MGEGWKGKGEGGEGIEEGKEGDLGMGGVSTRPNSPLSSLPLIPSLRLSSLIRMNLTQRSLARRRIGLPAGPPRLGVVSGARERQPPSPDESLARPE